MIEKTSRTAPRHERAKANSRRKKKTAQKAVVKAYVRALKTAPNGNKPQTFGGNKEQRMTTAQQIDNARTREANRMYKDYKRASKTARNSIQKTAYGVGRTVGKVTNTSKPMMKRELHEVEEHRRQKHSF